MILPHLYNKKKYLSNICLYVCLFYAFSKIFSILWVPKIFYFNFYKKNFYVCLFLLLQARKGHIRAAHELGHKKVHKLVMIHFHINRLIIQRQMNFVSACLCLSKQTLQCQIYFLFVDVFLFFIVARFLVFPSQPILNGCWCFILQIYSIEIKNKRFLFCLISV